MNILTPKQRAGGALRVALIKGLAARSTDPFRAERIADELGESVTIRAAVAPLTTTTQSALTFAPLDATLSDGFVDSLRSLNALDASSAAMIKVASNHAVQVIAATATSTLVQEGKPKPAQALSFASQAPSMRKVVGWCVVNDETLRGVNAQAAIEGALRGGVAIGSGALLLDVLADSAPSVAASGTTAAAFLADLSAALSLISVGAGSRLYAAIAPDLLKRLALLDSDKLLTSRSTAAASPVSCSCRMTASSSIRAAARSRSMTLRAFCSPMKGSRYVPRARRRLSWTTLRPTQPVRARPCTASLRKTARH